MKVISREVTHYGIDSQTAYEFNTGHVFYQWNSGNANGFTPKGYGVSLKTLKKLAQIISQYEDRRLQMN